MVESPLHAPGVTLLVVVSWTPSAGVTPPSSLLRAHASVLNPPLAYGLTLVNGSVPVAVSPGWEEDLPDVLSAYLSLRAWTSTPAARVVHLPVTSHTTSAFPSFGPGRRSTMCRTATSVRRAFSGLQSFAHVQARRFAHHPGRSSRYGICHRAAVVSTSEPLVVRYLPTPGIC